MPKTWLVTFRGSDYVRAENEDQAIDNAWTDHGIHAEDIIKVTLVDDNEE
jgi:hypothetical protein